MVHGADVPARTAAGGTLSAISSDRRGGIWIRGAGRRCRNHSSVRPAAAPAGPDRHEIAGQFAWNTRVARGLPGELTRYFGGHEAALDEDSKRRLKGNPLRILDSKNPDMQRIVGGAPLLLDSLDAESRAHFESLCAHLRGAGIEYHVEPHLVRGLDYYTRTVFEWTTDALGSQSTICAGGRYDGLVAQLGGAGTPGIGWAMGQERIVMLLEKQGLSVPRARPQVYLVLAGERTEIAGFKLAEQLRSAWPDLALQVNLAGEFQNAIQACGQERRAVCNSHGG